MNYTKHYCKYGFTLAEVLITLGIIGIVAALTIPTLINNSTKQQTAEKLKKIYSTIAQAKNSYIADNGSISNWITDDMKIAGTGAQLFAETYLTPYLQISKNCLLSTAGECSEKINYLTAGGSTTGYTDSTYYKFYLNDGSFISVSYFSSRSLMYFVFDVNGQNKPNTFGKDVFLFLFYPDGRFLAEPPGVNRNTMLTDPNWGCNKTGGQGTYCAGLIMKDGWQISDDYPW